MFPHLDRERKPRSARRRGGSSGCGRTIPERDSRRSHHPRGAPLPPSFRDRRCCAPDPLIVFPLGGKGGIGSIVVAAISFFFASFFFLGRPVETVGIRTAAGRSKLWCLTHGSVTNHIPNPIRILRRVSNRTGARKPNAFSDVVLRGLGYKGLRCVSGLRSASKLIFFRGRYLP
jgi:hypothetical protein